MKQKNMDKNAIKAIVQNYQWSTMDDIEEVLQFIADSKMNELGADIVFETQYEEGGQVSSERTADGKQQVGIGILPLSTIKTDKELGLETDPLEERKEFIEVILQTFHELRHVKQNHDMIDNPIVTADTLGMTREQIINDSFPGFRSRFNYESSMIEIDAMRTSLIEAVQFFQDMETDITPDEVFQVMKEKEFSYLNYDLENFGDSYETAMNYFEQIYGKPMEIKGLEELINELPEDKRAIFDTQCQELLTAYNAEPNTDKKLDILRAMSLRMSPELQSKYPLSPIQTQKQDSKTIEIPEESPEQETTTKDNQTTRLTFFDRVGNELDNVINGMENFEGKMYASVDRVVAKTEQFVKSTVNATFDQILLKAGFSSSVIQGIKQTIKSVNPRTLIAMDNILSKTRDKTLTKGGMEDGNEQDYR